MSRTVYGKGLKFHAKPGGEGGKGPHGSFRNLGVPYFGVLIIRILLFRVLYSGPLFPVTPKSSESFAGKVSLIDVENGE